MGAVQELRLGHFQTSLFQTFQPFLIYRTYRFLQVSERFRIIQIQSVRSVVG